MRSTRRLGIGIGLTCLALSACGGLRSNAPAPASALDATLTVRVRVPAAFAGTTIAVSVYPAGARAPQFPSTSARLNSPACELAGIERTCSLIARVPAGSVDVGVRVAGAGRSSLSGTALRREIAPGTDALSLAFDGAPSRWQFSAQPLAAPADGVAHDVPFAVAAEDAQGFTLLAGAPPPPATLDVAGDLLHQLAISSDGGGAFTAHYGGQAVGDVTLTADAPGASAATVPFAALAVSPAQLALDPGKTATFGVSLAHYAGSFEAAASSSNCTVTPASAEPARAGAPVQFAVRMQSRAGCEITVSATQLQVPIVIPVKNGIAQPGIGIGPSKIQHVVIVLQENRSFDNIFGGLDKSGKPFPGADTVSNPLAGEPTPHNHLGQPVAMATGLLEECYDPYHYHADAVTDIDGGKMDGFDHEGVIQENCAPAPAPTNYVYRTIEYDEVEPYWTMGEQYAISDRMFEPFTSASYGPHLYLVSGQSMHTIDNPNGGAWGCDNTSGGLVAVIIDKKGGESNASVPPCFMAPTLGDIMDQRGVAWRYYAAGKGDFGSDWSAYDSFDDIRYGPDWSAKVVNPPAQFITDVGNGTLAAVTWITPTNATSDHPQAHSNEGPEWITSLVDAIGESKFWSTTAIFITWDDWGGWYDHVPPPVTGPVGLGIRAPVIVISPYTRNHYVSHVQHTTGSILHFAEETFDLPSLGEEDEREDDFQDAFDYGQAPTAFTPFTQKLPKAEIMRAASDAASAEHLEKAGD